MSAIEVLTSLFVLKSILKINSFMKKLIFNSLLCCLLTIPLCLQAQQIISIPIADASIGATFTYTLVEEDVNVIYKIYKLVKKEEGVIDVVARETLRTSLINLFRKQPKATSEKLRYAKLCLASIEITETLVNKGSDKLSKETRIASSLAAFLQELMPSEVKE
jgi:hypothetical protein